VAARRRSMMNCICQPHPLMRKIAAVWIAFSLWAMAAPNQEPLVGKWQMIDQRVDRSRTRPLPIALKITQNGGGLTCTYYTGATEKVSMSFTVRLDGVEGVVHNGEGQARGTAKLTKSGEKYELVLHSYSRRPEPGTMALSEKNQILTCESEADMPDR